MSVSKFAQFQRAEKISKKTMPIEDKNHQFEGSSIFKIIKVSKSEKYLHIIKIFKKLSKFNEKFVVIKIEQDTYLVCENQNKLNWKNFIINNNKKICTYLYVILKNIYL